MTITRAFLFVFQAHFQLVNMLTIFYVGARNLIASKRTSTQNKLYVGTRITFIVLYTLFYSLKEINHEAQANFMCALYITLVNGKQLTSVSNFVHEIPSFKNPENIPYYNYY